MQEWILLVQKNPLLHVICKHKIIFCFLPQTDIYFRNLLIRYTRRVRITITVKILSIPFHITSNACMISSVFILISPFH